jgi:hypothetical protein
MEENLKTTTISKSSHGGIRKGSGRKSRMSYQARELLNYKFDELSNEILEKSFELALNGDKDMLKFLISQRIGLPSSTINTAQTINTGNDTYNIINNPIIMQGVKSFEALIKEQMYLGAREK